MCEHAHWWWNEMHRITINAFFKHMHICVCVCMKHSQPSVYTHLTCLWERLRAQTQTHIYTRLVLTQTQWGCCIFSLFPQEPLNLNGASRAPFSKLEKKILCFSGFQRECYTRENKKCLLSWCVNVSFVQYIYRGKERAHASFANKKYLPFFPLPKHILQSASTFNTTTQTHTLTFAGFILKERKNRERERGEKNICFSWCKKYSAH